MRTKTDSFFLWFDMMLENLLVQMSIKSFVASLQGHEKLLYLKKDFTKIFVACASDET